MPQNQTSSRNLTSPQNRKETLYTEPSVMQTTPKKPKFSIASRDIETDKGKVDKGT